VILSKISSHGHHIDILSFLLFCNFIRTYLRTHGKVPSLFIAITPTPTLYTIPEYDATLSIYKDANALTGLPVISGGTMS